MSYCPELFNNIYVEKIRDNQVQLANCCLQPRSDYTNKIDFYHQYLEKQRKFNADYGILPLSCKACTDLEKLNVQSRRQQLLKDHTGDILDFTPKLKKLNYNCENTCNLKCITCSSFNSSSWIADEKKLGIPITYKGKDTKKNKLVLEYNLQGIETVSFNGGEPLLTRDHHTILEYLITNNDSTNINVEYNTNATCSVDQQTIELWKKFKSITLACSIDGIEESFEYTRFPANWNNIKKNIKSYQILDVTVSVSMTVGLHNILYVGDTFKWANQNNLYMGINNCQGIFELKNWPLHLKNKLQDFLVTLPDTEFKTDLFNLSNGVLGKNLYWIRYLAKLDTIRNNSWKQSLYKLYNLDPAFFDTFID